MNTQITWTSKGRSRKADQGHTIIRWGEGIGRYGRTRQYAECQCGHVMGAWVFDTLLSSHARHVKKALED